MQCGHLGTCCGRHWPEACAVLSKWATAIDLGVPSWLSSRPPSCGGSLVNSLPTWFAFNKRHSDVPPRRVRMQTKLPRPWAGRNVCAHGPFSPTIASLTRWPNKSNLSYRRTHTGCDAVHAPKRFQPGTNLFQRLGMSLGPFELLGANEHNKHGHFEAMPSYRLDQELLNANLRLQRRSPRLRPKSCVDFSPANGHWQWQPSLISTQQVERGRTFVEQLVAAGHVSGFKDPRVPLLWPFWNRVFSQFAGLRVVPIFLVRSPHEIAMSIFAAQPGQARL